MIVPQDPIPQDPQPAARPPQDPPQFRTATYRARWEQDQQRDRDFAAVLDAAAKADPKVEAERQDIARQLGKHQSHVFVNAKGKAMQSWPTTCDRIWKKCLERAGITDFRWHDLRHTWASWHVQAGTDIYTLKELGGWETLEMPMRYAHLSATHLKDAANRVVLGTNSSQALSKTEACS